MMRTLAKKSDAPKVFYETQKLSFIIRLLTRLKLQQLLQTLCSSLMLSGWHLLPHGVISHAKPCAIIWTPNKWKIYHFNRFC